MDRIGGQHCQLQSHAFERTFFHSARSLISESKQVPRCFLMHVDTRYSNMIFLAVIIVLFIPVGGTQDNFDLCFEVLFLFAQ